MGTAVQLSTLQGCQLAIGRYPPFHYDGRGGGGPAPRPAAQEAGLLQLRFDPQGLRIPALQAGTTRWLGLPLPRGVVIAITPHRLEGELDPVSGAIRLVFEACFQPRLGRWYQPAPLQVATTLVSGAVQGRRRSLRGAPLDAAGRAVLVGVAQVPPSGDPWLDRFLGLPDEALALLRCRMEGIAALPCYKTRPPLPTRAD